MSDPSHAARTTATRPRAPRPAAAVTAAVLVAVVLAGCSGGGGSSAEEPGPSTSSSAPAAPSGSSAPDASGSAATAPGAVQGPQAARTLVEGGVSITVPPGWNAASLEPASIKAAVAGQRDPSTAAFLSERLQGMAKTGGLMYLYDLDDLDQGVLSAVEVYRYPGTDPGAVATQTVAPELEKAGLAPQLGTADLPAGQATTVTGRLDGQGVSLTNEVALLVLGPSVVSLSATFGDSTKDVVQGVLASVASA